MKKILIALLIIFCSGTVYSQHDHGAHEHPKPETKKKATGKKKAAPAKTIQNKTAQNDSAAPVLQSHHHPAVLDTTKPVQQGYGQSVHAGHEGTGHTEHQSSMSHSYSLNLPMTRNGSGTGWLPDESPMYGHMFHTKKWMYMLHYNAFLRYNKQDILEKGSRGDAKVDMPNWAMFMGQRKVGAKGLFHFSTMLSLDPLIAGGEGYPLLFQTGETYKGKPLVDRQHPHDFISELSVSYAHALSPKADVFLYLGYPGEPAIGPVAFMHRPSALNNPDATLSHHWTDATHITFGVATLGVRYGNWKLEGSSFTGREPGEDRYNFDKPRFDSWSGRLSFNPASNWAVQVSHGFIKEPEALHAGENVNRTTASVTFSKYTGFGSYVNATALWGVNKTKNHSGEHAVLAEASYNLRKLGIYGRYEWVQKSVEELVLQESVYGHDAIFPVHAFTAGINYDLFKIGAVNFAGGGHFTFFNPDKRLSSLYGQNPLAGQVYLRIYPGMMGRKTGRFFLPY